MKIVVIGGTGLIGKKLIPLLRERGHEAVAASPASGVNTLTGEGLAEALASAQVVVHMDGVAPMAPNRTPPNNGMQRTALRAAADAERVCRACCHAWE
jgi:uncharacterized protein YbjT (DUF2867 family)